ncbi:DNA polymerase alpha subunit B N-terminal-domain-containing protein [Umbelopsis sp. PMI_123]|nr:DNA polymerase alpha subunit B N-terminal-domain-containing protein [Umbelopsis sp. PMI_123]
MSALRDELTQGLHLQDPDVINETVAICRQYNLKARDLVLKWEAFALRPVNIERNVSVPTIDLIRQLKGEIQRDFENAVQNKTKPSVNRSRLQTRGNEQNGLLRSSTNFTKDPIQDLMSELSGVQSLNSPIERIPIAGSDLGTASASITTQRFSERSVRNKIEESLNGHLNKKQPLREEFGNQPRCEISLAQEQTERYRYMFEKISERAEIIDDRIEYFSEVVMQHHNVQEFANPTRANQSSIMAVGRICCEDAAGKLNEQSVVLESSRSMGMGKRVKLNLSNLPGYSVFPGQVVALNGVNNSGKLLTVSEFLPIPLPSLAVHDAAELYEYNYGEKMQGQPIDICVAAGPYTLDDDLLYLPLEDLLQTMALEQPDILLLLGPFVPGSHPLLQNGEVDASPVDVFRTQVSARLQRFIQQCPRTRILLVPHSDDLIHEYAVFPQPAMVSKELGLPKGVVMLSNPSMIRINEMVVGIGNIDILFNLGLEEIARSKVASDRLARLTRHILQQRSFYPMFPPAPGDNLDLLQMPHIQMDVTPDILILPSRLKSFAKIVDSVMCINPGYLSKKQSGGTFARATVHPLQPISDGNVGVEGKIWERTRVDLIKI